MTGPPSRRPWRRAVALLAAAVLALLVLGTSAPASAHATLVSTDPAEGAVLEAAPDRIRFVFSEAVVGVPDGVRVFDAQGEEVASSTVVTGSELDVTLGEQVDEGTLVVAWRVVSEDGHPVNGSLSFSVGSPSASVAPVPAEAAGPVKAPLLLSVVRWAGYVGLFLAAGLVAFAVLFLPANATGPARRRVVTVARLGAATTVVAWLAALPLVAAYQLGGGASSLTKGSTWAALAATEYVVTATVVAGAALAVVLLGRGSPPSRGRGAAAVTAAAIAVCSPALTGHTRAATPEALAVGADLLHLLAGGVWLGGLVGLALALPDLSARGVVAAEVLARFSAVAAGVLVALVVTGTLLAWRIVGSWSAVLDTGYGQLLVIKILAALVAVGLATWNRFSLLPRLRDATRRRDRRAGAGLLVRSTGAEAAVLVVVLLVTGVLVDRSPETTAAAATAPAGDPAETVQSASLGEVEVLATLTPLTTGPATLRLQLRDAAGEPTEGIEPPRVRLASDRVDLGAVALSPVDTGTYSAEVVLPSPGTWQLQVSLRTSVFTNPVATLEFTVPGG